MKVKCVREELRQYADTLAATAGAAHKHHQTLNDWHHCEYAVCLRAHRVWQRINVQIARPEKRRQNQPKLWPLLRRLRARIDVCARQRRNDVQLRDRLENTLG